jgi:hypothetical protein
MAESRGLAGGAHRDQAVDSPIDLTLHQGDKSVLVELAVAEGRDQGGKDAPEER